MRLTGRCPETDVQDDDASHERSSIGRREESQAGEDERDGHHDGDLRSVSHEDGKEHALLRRSEHVSVDQLPAELFLRIFGVHLVVSGDILVQSTQQNHRHLWRIR